MALVAQLHAREVRSRLWNPPCGSKPEPTEAEKSASYRAALVAESSRLIRDNEQLSKENKRLSAELANAQGTIAKQNEAFALVKSMPKKDHATAAEIAVGLKHQTLKGIILAVSEHTGTSVQGMMSRGRTGKVVYARWLAFHTAKSLTTLSLTQIGQRFGRDHTTVFNGVEQIEARLLTEEKLRADLEAIKARLGA